METRDWVMIGIAAITLLTSWAQFWVKERLFSKDIVASDPFLKFFKSKWGISLFLLTGIVAVFAIVYLVYEVSSEEPLTRLACVKISGLTTLTLINIFLVQTVYTLRRLAKLKEEMEKARDDAMIFAVALS